MLKAKVDGVKVKEMMKSKGYNVYSFAKRINISRTTLIKMIAGEKVGIVPVFTVARGLNCFLKDICI